MNYRESHLQLGKGQRYHAAFSDEPYRNMVWNFEKGILDLILSMLYKDAQIHHLDFACGTGRILSHLEDRTTSAVGVDISPSMLKVARKNNRKSEIVEADLTRNDVLGDRRFNLITAFRFFPNAEPELRIAAMQVLSRHLDDNGYLVFNNHKNLGSTRNRIARLFGRRGYKGMSISDVKALLLENNLEIVKMYPLCVFPASAKNKLLPLFLLSRVEALFNMCRIFQNFGENLIFVCGRPVN